MPHKLERFSKSILQEPQLSSLKQFEEISQYLHDRNFNDYQAAHEEASLKLNRSEGTDLAETTVGILDVSGTLTYKPTIFQALCGGTSYVSLIEQAEQLAKMDNISTVVMNVNSGGGQAYRCFESARQIKEILSSSDKKLIAYVDGMSASAAYALTSVCDEVYINPDAQVGSIGVVVQLMNDNKKLQKEGYDKTYITAGDSKVPFDSEGEFRQEFLDDIQDRVSELYDGFVTHVATNRDISEKQVRDTEAKVFSANTALELGLIDGIMEGEEFQEYLATLNEKVDDKEAKAVVDETSHVSMDTDIKSKETEMSNTNESINMEQFEAMQAQLAAYQAKEKEQMKAETIASLDAFSFLADSKEAVTAFMTSEDADPKAKELLNAVMQDAQNSQTKLEEASANLVAQEQAKVEAATEALEQMKVEKEELKQEFATSETASTETPAELSAEEIIKQKVAAKKAAK